MKVEIEKCDIDCSVSGNILEKLNIIGCKIWILYKDVCDKEIKQMEELLDKLKQDGDVVMSISGKNSVMEYLNSYPPYRENSNHNEREELVTNSSSESSNCNPLIIGDSDRTLLHYNITILPVHHYIIA